MRRFAAHDFVLAVSNFKSVFSDLVGASLII